MTNEPENPIETPYITPILEAMKSIKSEILRFGIVVILILIAAAHLDLEMK